MFLVKRLGAVDGTTSIKTKLKGDFGLIGILALAFFFIEIFWHDVEKGLDLFLALHIPKHWQFPPFNIQYASLTSKTKLYFNVLPNWVSWWHTNKFLSSLPKDNLFTP